MEFFERKTASSKDQVLGKKGSEGAVAEGGNPLSTLSPAPPPPPPPPPPLPSAARPPPPPPPPPVLTNRRVIVTGRSRSAISFVQLDGDCGNDAEEEEEERMKEEGVWTAEGGSSFKQRHLNPLNRARERRRARLEAEHMRPPEDVDAGGASARVGDTDVPRPRERASRADEDYEELIAKCFLRRVQCINVHSLHSLQIQTVADAAVTIQT